MADHNCRDESIDENEAQPPPDLRTPGRLPGPISTDTVHHLLANERRRHLLSFLTERPDETVPIDDLVDRVAGRERPDPGPATHRERVAIDLYHVHLPKLADVGVIDFDPVGGTVRYDGPEALSTMLGFTKAIEEAHDDEKSE